MALQVWLPLNDGTLKQQGLNSVAASGTAFTVDNGGKLGKCIKTTTSGAIDLGYNGNQVNSGSISFGGWFKFNQSEISSAISGKTYTSSATSATGNLIGNNSYGGVSLQWNSNNMYSSGSFSSISVQSYLRSSTNGARATSSFTLPFDTWTHIFLTYDKPGNLLGLWINGELKYTYTCVAFTDARSYNLFINLASIAGGNGPSAYIPFLVNDVRVYNHCLSEKEIKEIAKGLVLHYPLFDSFNDEKENLIPSNYWSGTKTISLSADTTNYGVVNYPAVSVEVDTTYFWTVDFRIISGGNNLTSIGVDTNCSGGSYSGNDSAHTVITTVHPNLTQIKAGEWQTAYCITKVKADATNPTIFHTIYGRSSTATTLTVEWRNLMLVASTEVVPFRGLHSNIIYDCSGFCNNGTLITNTTTISNDVEKYQASMHFNGTYDGILIENLQLSNIINSAVTYAFWIKPEGESGARSVYFGSYSTGPSWSIEKTAGNVMRSYWNGSPDETCSGATITDGVWQHVCMVKEGINNIKVYINGEQKWQSTAAHNNLNFPTTFRIGRDTRSNDGTPYKGLMSDFRIYATALSAEDIKSLYQNEAYIDASGNIYGQVH